MAEEKRGIEETKDILDFVFSFVVQEHNQRPVAFNLFSEVFMEMDQLLLVLMYMTILFTTNQEFTRRLRARQSSGVMLSN